MKAALAVPLMVVLAAGCARAHSDLIAAPKTLLGACQRTARAVGYPVPCPTRIPPGLTETGHNGNPDCTLHVIGPANCNKSWRGWVVGSSTTLDQHLVLVASPTALRNYAKVVNGPAWYPKAHVRPLGWLSVNGWRMRAVFVPPATNDGSAFMHHVVLIWTVGRHTYGVGFHDIKGISQTVNLDKTLAEGIRLIDP